MVQSIFPLSDQITEMAAVRTPYITAKHRLFKAAIVFTESLTVADLAAIEADFDGYVEVTYTTCGAVYVDPAGGVSFDLTVALFLDTGNVTPNDIYGGWVEDSGGDLLFAWQLQVPYSMAANLDAMNVNTVINRFGPRNVVIVVNGVPQ